MKKQVSLIAITGLIASLSLQADAQVTDSTKRDTTTKKVTTAAAKDTSASAAVKDVFGAISTTGYTNKFSAAVTTAGLQTALGQTEQYTVFAPTDKAVDSTTVLNNPGTATPVLNHHVVKGQYTKSDIIAALSKGKGTATLNTVDGGTITLKVNAQKQLELSDSGGHKAQVTVFDVKGTNGVVHVINNVLMP